MEYSMRRTASGFSEARYEKPDMIDEEMIGLLYSSTYRRLRQEVD